MKLDEKRKALALRLAEFRSRSYQALVAEINDRSPHDCLAHFEETFPDGTGYQMEFNVFWDDEEGGNVRVLGDLNADPHLPIPGTMVYLSQVTDSFIMAPDGSFVGE
jgi:hypothetical protein